ncbi:hypothetical protein [Arenibaculum pallidiluteum]|uniref:hypothetical protein n=1 Tax=Arenibaculum pallidiluteum TaxID=2812559 RepID=UPI001A966BF5|nr:hypothetical protein [Arenibaculum pallidiluteum]
MSASPADASTRRATALILILGPLAYGLLSLALGQDANWDLRNYHWYAGYALVSGRLGIDMVPSQTPSFYNPLLDAPLYLLGSTLPAPVAMFLWSLLHGLNFVLVFLLARELLRVRDARRRVWAAAAVAGVGVLGAGGISLLGTTFHDNLLSLGPLTGLLVIARNRRTLLEDGRLARAAAIAALAGLPAGAAMGLKQPAVIWCVGICFGFFFAAGGFRRRFALSFCCGLGILGGIALTNGWWMWHLWQSHGNPLHPYFNHVFKSHDAAISDYRDMHNLSMSPTLLDRLLLPFRWTLNPNIVGEIPLPGDTPWRDLRIPLLYAVAPIAAAAALVSGRSRAAERHLMAALALAFGTWAAMFSIYRYLVAMEFLAPLALCTAMAWLPLGRRTRAGLAAAALVVVQATTVPGTWGRVPWSRGLVEVEVPPIPAPADAMVLMAGYQPLSFAIPAFPPEIPFVRIQSNFIHPDSWDNGYIHRLRSRVAAHRGAFYALSTVPDTDLAEKAAEAYGLRLDPGSCRLVRSNLNEDLNLCALHH